MDLINERTDILTGYKVQLLCGVSDCNTEDNNYIAIAKELVHSKKNITAFVGADCPSANMKFGRLVSRDDLAILHIHQSSSPFFSSRSLYRNSFDILGSNLQLTESLAALIKQYSWSHISVLFDYLDSSRLGLEAELDGAGSTAIQMLPVSDRDIPFEALLQSGNRIIVLMLGPLLCRRVLCLLHHHQLHHPSYQLIVVARTLQDLQAAETVVSGGLTCSPEQLAATAQGLRAVFLNHKLSQSSPAAPTDVSISFSQYKTAIQTDGSAISLPHERASLYFDAIWALAFVINSSIGPLGTELGLSISDYRYGNVMATDIIREQILKLNFEGVSGPIQFQNETGFTSRSVSLHQVANNSLVLFGVYEDTEFVYYKNFTFIDDVFDRVTTFEQVPLALAIFSLLATVLVFLVVLAAHVLTVHWRKKKSVKASSPMLAQMAYIGCHLLVMGTMILGLQQTLSLSPSQYCSLYQVINWNVFIGYTCLFSTLAVKMWRLYRLFVHVWQPGSRRLLSDRTLGVVVLLLLSITVAICLVWTVVDPYVPETSEQLATVHGTRVLLATVSCVCLSHHVWLGVLLLHNATVLLCTFVFACLTRKIKRQFFTTKSSFYLVLSVLITGGPIYIVHLLNISGTIEFIFLSFFLNTMVVACFVLLFLPPLVPVYRKKIRQRRREKYLKQFQLDMRKINVGNFRALRKRDTLDLRDFRNILLRFPYASRRNSVQHADPRSINIRKPPASPNPSLSSDSNEQLAITNSAALSHDKHLPHFHKHTSLITSQVSIDTVMTSLSFEETENRTFTHLSSFEEETLFSDEVMGSGRSAGEQSSELRAGAETLNCSPRRKSVVLETLVEYDTILALRRRE